MSHGDVVNLIKESGLHVRLTIGNPKDVQPTNNGQTVPHNNLNLTNTLNHSYFEQRNDSIGSTNNDGSGYQTRSSHT